MWREKSPLATHILERPFQSKHSSSAKYFSTLHSPLLLPSLPPSCSQYQNNKFLCAPSYETISHHLHALGWGRPRNQRLYSFTQRYQYFMFLCSQVLSAGHIAFSLGKKIVIVFGNTDCIKWQLDWKTVIMLG